MKKRNHHAIYAAALCAAVGTSAMGGVYGVRSSQVFYFANPTTYSSGIARNVVINGNEAAAIVLRPGGRKVVLFHRGADGRWTQDAAPLVDVDTTDNGNDDLALGDGVLALRIGPNMQIFARSGSAWVKQATAGTPQPLPNLAASGKTILAPRSACGVNVYEKSVGSGVWRVNGRIPGQRTSCPYGTGVALDGSVALQVHTSEDIGVYRRDGSNFDWVQEGNLKLPEGYYGFGSWAPTLRGNVAVADGGFFYLNGPSGWQFRQLVEPLDAVNTSQLAAPDFDGKLLIGISTGSGRFDFPEADIYQRNATGAFDQVARLYAFGYTMYADVNGSSAITSSQDEGSEAAIEFYDLPSPLPAPRAVVNDFEARDVSGLQQSAGSSFALANTGSNYVYRQSATSGESHAVLTNTEWNFSEKIAADITPTAFDGNDRWFGLGVRYIDANNQYYVTLRSSGKLQLKKKVDGAFSTLDEVAMPIKAGTTYHVELNAARDVLSATVTDRVTREQHSLYATDASLAQGRTALMTYRTRADFDNVLAGPTNGFTLAKKPTLEQYGDEDPYDTSESFTTLGGSWSGSDDDFYAVSQTSTAGDARAFFGVPTDDQRVSASLRLDQFAATTSGAWIGLLARWVDARNFYYLTLRSTGRLEIRKQVNGVITTLKSVPFTTVPGRFYNLEFEVQGNELHAFVDGALVAGALDNDIERGQYGMGSYRGAFTYRSFAAVQP